MRRRHLDIATAIVSLTIIALIFFLAPINATSEDRQPTVVHSLNDQP
jgi:methylglyoxal synthase